MANLREIAFDIDFAKKKAYNNQDITLEELTQNDHNSSVLALRLLQNEQPIDLTGITVVLNFLLPDGSDYKIDIAQSHNINTRTSLVTYSIPKMVLSQVGVVIGTVSLYKAGYRYTSIVQFRFEVVEDIVNDGEIVDSEKYPILLSMINDINMIHADEEGRKIAEEGRINAELERIEAEDEREVSEATRTLSELERQESEEGRVLAESNRELLESERQKAELLRIASISEMEANEMIRVEGESLRVSSELERKESELNRANAESVRAENEANRMSSEESRCKAEEDRVNAELLREQKQNEFNARAEEVAVRIEEESQRISDLVEIEESKLVKPGDMMDYMGNRHNSLKEKADSDVDYAVKTAIGEFNYLDYEGQHITATNSIEGHARSAILKGNTLVNCIKTQSYAPTTWPTINLKNVLVQPNKKYIAILKHLPVDCQWAITNVGESQSTHVQYNKAMYSIFTSPSTTTATLTLHINKGVQTDLTLEELQKVQPMIIEYQEGMENWDIPYFEGMQSVRMPVLKSTGKNLCDNSKNFIGNINGVNGVFDELKASILSMPIKVNHKNYVGSRVVSSNSSVSFNQSTYRVYNSNMDYIGSSLSDLPETGGYVVLRCIKSDGSLFLDNELSLIEFQLEENTRITQYEPHKSNILTAPSDLELRGIGDVQDTLDLMTGEVVERIGEVTLDGSEDWHLNQVTSNNIAHFSAKVLVNNLKVNADRIYLKPISNYYNSYTQPQLCNKPNNYYGISLGWNDNAICIRDKNFELTDEGLQRFKQHLSQNPITVQYLLEIPVIKTVDLSENVVYSYNGTTHYSCSSEDGSLVPTLSVKVPTDVQATIAQQRNTIVALEAENEALKEGQMLLESGHEQQEEEIISTQDAVNFLLFGEVGLMMLRLQEEQSKEMDKMAVYIANQILKRKVSYELAVSKYPQFKEDIDSILIMEGREDLIQG